MGKHATGGWIQMQAALELNDEESQMPNHHRLRHWFDFYVDYGEW